MFRKMLYDNIPKYLNLFTPKIILLILNFIYSFFVILLIVFSSLYLSNLNALDEKKNINYFVVKKKLIGQIIVNLFILIFLIIKIIGYFRFICCCCEKMSNERDNIVNKNNKVDNSLSHSESKGNSARTMMNNFIKTKQ